MTQADARAAAIADGIQEDQVTPEIIAFYGHVPADPTAGLVVGPVYPPDRVRETLVNMGAEAKANQTIALAATEVKNLLGWLIGMGVKLSLAVVLTLALHGCGASTAAVRGVHETQASVKALNDQHLSFEETFIQNYRVNETDRIQDLYAKAMASAESPVTTTRVEKVRVPVKAVDGADAFVEKDQAVNVTTIMVPVNVANALQTQRVRLLQQMETNIAKMRGQQALICSNAANAVAYLEGLRAYFERKQATLDALQAAEQSLFSFLETFIKKDKPATP